MPFGPKELVAVDPNQLVGLVPVANAPGYFINRNGDVFCIRKLHVSTDSDGYDRVSLYVGRKKKRPGIHQLLAAAFLPPPGPDQDEVRHLDGRPQNRDVGNLATHPDTGGDPGAFKQVQQAKEILDKHFGAAV